MARSLNIVGASARAAAFSAKAAGFELWCADLFADTDLQAIAAVERVEDYPHGLRRALQSGPQAPWMYTGALENYPDLVDELSELRPLYGNSGRALRLARDPVFWSRALAEAGLKSPRVSLSGEDLPRDGSWLRKPIRSANGRDISLRTPQVARGDAGEIEDRWYFQERKLGLPIAAVFVAAEGNAFLLGVTQQLVGGDWRRTLGELGDATNPALQAHLYDDQDAADEAGFRYCGSIGPVMLDDQRYRTFERVGRVLARACGLVGLFGVDAILNAEAVWPVEVNPRYTASIEVLERASAERTQQRRSKRLLSVEWHEAACTMGRLPSPLGQSAAAIAGKLIYFAPRDLCFTSSAARFAVERNLEHPQPAVADIPFAEAMIRRGQPVLTLLAHGTSRDEVRKALTHGAGELERHLEQAE